MESQINHRELKAYCAEVANKILKGKENHPKFVSGKELLSWSGIQQADHFVLAEIFDSWDEQMKNSRSRFFDYEDPEVLLAEKKYASKLSFHIKVPSEDLVGLYEKALEKTLVFFFFPDLFLLSEFEGSKEHFSRAFKYLKFYPDECRDIQQRLDSGEDLKQAIENQEFGEEDQASIISFEKYVPFDPEIFVPKQIPGNEPVRDQIEQEPTVGSIRDTQTKVFEKFKKTPSLGEKFNTDVLLHEESEEGHSNVIDLRNLGLNEKLYFSKQFFGGNKFQFEEFLGLILSADSFHDAREKFNTHPELSLSGKDGMDARNRFLSGLELCF